MSEGQSDEVCFGNEPAKPAKPAQPAIEVSTAPYEFWGGPRSVAVIGHQEYWTGWFHGFGITFRYADGAPVTTAFVEDALGNIQCTEPYKIKFLKPMGRPQ